MDPQEKGTGNSKVQGKSRGVQHARDISSEKLNPQESKPLGKAVGMVELLDPSGPVGNVL